MASNPSPAKRARTGAGPAGPAYSHSRQLHPPPQHHSQLSRPLQNGGTIFMTSTSRPQNEPVQNAQAQGQTRHRRRTKPPPATSQPRPPAASDLLASDPPDGDPMENHDNVTMLLHEALEILDPTSQMPQDLYHILVYAAVVHPDVGQMLDEFARAKQDARRQRGEFGERDASAAPGAGAGVDAGGFGDDLLELVEREERERAEARAARKAARKAAREAAREAKEARTREHRQLEAASSVIKAGMDKDFTHLVRKAEEELGWTGRWDADRHSKQSRAALGKEPYWYSRAVDVRESLSWMQKQLIEEMAVAGITFGTKRNALSAMMQVLHMVMVDDRSAVGRNLREHWFFALQENFLVAMASLSSDDLGKLRNANQGKWTNDLKALIKLAVDKELPDAILRHMLLMIDPNFGDFIESEDESSERPDETYGDEPGDSDDDVESKNSGETSSESEADSESDEESE